MNKLFENETTYTANAYVQFLRFHNKKYNMPYIAYTVFWAFLFFLCIFLAFNSGARLQGVVITIVLICFIIYRLVHPKMIVDKEFKSDKLSDNNVNKFTFYDKEFEVSNKKGKFNIKYFMIHKIFETSDYFYLYVSKENAFLVSKYAFSLGSAKEFATFMKVKCKSKYKIANI